MNRPTMLLRAMLHQCSIDTEVSTTLDARYALHRLENEGSAFLTLTLPTLSDSLESAFETGRFTLPNGFKPFRRGGTLPAFLQGLFKRVFEIDGRLRSDPCVDSIYWIRQISRFWKKPKLPCSPERELAAIKRFRSVEEELVNDRKAILSVDPTLDLVATILWSSVFYDADGSSIVCGHGPGVTADRRLSNERYRIADWYDRFEDSFPCADHAFTNYGQAWSGGGVEGISGIKYKSIEEETPVKVVFVPKTLSSPRVIAIEPSSMQYVQQGVARYMVDRLETHRLTEPVRFRDQTVNQSLARQGSVDGRLATLDLSDASDRVSSLLVARIFRRSRIGKLLFDARSLSATLPTGETIVLEKYASMGSALCFPVEACVFYTLVLAAIFEKDGTRPSYKAIRRLRRRVAIYGDDIIVPVEYVDVVTRYLERYLLKVNSKKSFSRSAFRESCGGDYYRGYSVKPVYAREWPHRRREDWTPSTIMSWISTSDQFYLAGRWHLAQCIREMIEDVLRRRLPRSRFNRAGLAFSSLLFDTHLFYEQETYSYKQRRLVYRPIKQVDRIDGDEVACLNKTLGRGRGYSPQHSYFEHLQNRGHRWLWNSADELQGSFWAVYGVQHDAGPQSRSKERFTTVPSMVASDVQPNPRSDNHFGTAVSSIYDATRGGLREVPREEDFQYTTKRGVFALKRQWVTIFS